MVDPRTWAAYANPGAFQTPAGFDRVAELLPGESVIVDLGCGYGRSLARFAQEGFSHLFGVEYSPEMIAAARALVPSATFVQACLPAQRPVLPAADCVLALTILNTLSSDADALAFVEMADGLLRPGGYLVLDDYPIIPTQEYRDRYRNAVRSGHPMGTFVADNGELFRHRPIEVVAALLPANMVIQSTTFGWYPSMNGRRTKLYSLLIQQHGQ